MKKRVVLVVTLDTKGVEAKYLKDGLERYGLEVLVVDSGILGTTDFIKPTITHQEVAFSAGESLEVLQKTERGPAIEKMSVGVERCCLRLYQEGRMDGIMAIGGGAGSLLAAPALKSLPIGLPKLLVSVVACGKSTFGPFVGTKDIIIVHSVADILGLNPIISAVFDNAINAMAGMLQRPRKKESWSERIVGIMMNGNTTDCVMRVKELLEKQGFLVIGFHANGVGGRAYEYYASQKRFCGVLDIATHELVNEIAGGMNSAGPNRMEAAGAAGIPQIIVPGSVDFIVDGVLEEIKPKWPGRKFYPDNPIYTLIRSSREDLAELARQMAIKINAAKGPTVLVIPLKGFSKANRPGTAIYDPDGDKCFIEDLKRQTESRVQIVDYDGHINDPGFADVLVRTFMTLQTDKK